MALGGKVACLGLYSDYVCMSVQISVCSALGTIQHHELQVSVCSRCQVTCPIAAKQKAKLTNQIHHTRRHFNIACILMIGQLMSY